MKAAIHPEMHVVMVHCACGNEFETTSTAEELRLEICGACHPFFTGKKRAVMARGRVESFQKKYGTGPQQGVDVVKEAKAKKKK